MLTHNGGIVDAKFLARSPAAGLKHGQPLVVRRSDAAVARKKQCVASLLRGAQASGRATIPLTVQRPPTRGQDRRRLESRTGPLSDDEARDAGGGGNLITLGTVLAFIAFLITDALAGESTAQIVFVAVLGGVVALGLIVVLGLAAIRAERSRAEQVTDAVAAVVADVLSKSAGPKDPEDLQRRIARAQDEIARRLRDLRRKSTGG